MDGKLQISSSVVQLVERLLNTQVVGPSLDRMILFAMSSFRRKNQHRPNTLANDQTPS
ncbi:hypothetical protein M422DRAFT_36667 [Sphaerobolus stellatus SS14]|uniref:Uncharacterized protein n=1 Tax=Sphaerobolus stellatus (strain SS14) TaxID=990650 RepID=A0A0C9UIL5_SPHS4|nr:hypothetical protein M422DRAFT_38876 [Sphaerobolus stellatus SS14]KIJ30173.1 hypothetical protein M422DRAFT_36667 [Sphaerobolus stellatus SS14]